MEYTASNGTFWTIQQECDDFLFWENEDPELSGLASSREEAMQFIEEIIENISS